jgi:hypothetical protein
MVICGSSCSHRPRIRPAAVWDRAGRVGPCSCRPAARHSPWRRVAPWQCGSAGRGPLRRRQAVLHQARPTPPVRGVSTPRRGAEHATLPEANWACGNSSGTASQGSSTTTGSGANTGSGSTSSTGMNIPNKLYVRFASIATELMRCRELTRCAKSGREQLQQNYSITSSATA